MKGKWKTLLELYDLPDTEQGHREAYSRFRDELISNGELCSHPEHQPEAFKIQ
jgi:hypothetical protein